MKRYFLAIAIMALIASFLFYTYYDISVRVIFYHLSVICGFSIGIFLIGIPISYIKNKRLRLLLHHLLYFSFLFTLSLFYLISIGSLHFWGKVIEFKLFESYFSNLNGLIYTLPIKPFLIYFLLSLYIALNCALYRFIKPHSELKRDIPFRSLIIRSVITIVIMIFLYSPLIHYKRLIHATGEPITGFIFPRTWHSGAEMEIYKDILVKNTQEDKDCTLKIENEPLLETEQNFILIVLDALRRDHLHCYGYHRNTSPFLDSLLKTKDAFAIPNNFSLSTNTLSGVANIFTSKTIENFSFSSLGLMKYMKIKGFTTYAFVTGAHSQWYWLSDIYRKSTDNFYESKSKLSQNDDDFPTLKKIVGSELKNNFFAYIHLMSPHLLGYKSNDFKNYLPDKASFTVDKKMALTNNYDNGVLQSDYILSQIFSKLERDHLLKNTTVFITSDHGELLGEDNRFGHNSSLHRVLQCTPLIIYDKDLSWYKNRFASTSLDILPTIADRMGYSISDCWEGRSLGNENQDFEISMLGSPPASLLHGILSQKDSTFKMDFFNNKQQVEIRNILRKGKTRWEDVKIN